MAEFQGRARIIGQKNLLDRHHLRLMQLDHLVQTGKDGVEPPGESRLAGDADGAAGDKGQHSRRRVNDAVAGHARTGVYAENPLQKFK